MPGRPSPRVRQLGAAAPRRAASCWRRTLALLRALSGAVASRGARFVLLYVPASFEVDDLDWRRTRERWGLEGPGWSIAAETLEPLARLAGDCRGPGAR